jgi:prepilin-type N-terminal cleavage/methylation domain-containing protein
MKNKGFTLIEFSISFLIVSVGIMATFSVLQSVARYSSIDHSRVQAAYLAEEGMEVIRNMRDNHFLNPRGDFPVGKGTSTLLDARSMKFPDDENCTGPEGDYELLSLPEPSDPSANNVYICTYRPRDARQWRREISVEHFGMAVPSTGMGVSVKVTWIEKGSVQELNLYQNFFNWYEYYDF